MSATRKVTHTGLSMAAKVQEVTDLAPAMGVPMALARIAATMPAYLAPTLTMAYAESCRDREARLAAQARS